MMFIEKPKDFDSAVMVSGCFILHEREFLYLKNGRKGEYTGLWGVAGGKIEENENPTQAIKREIKEETGLDLLEAHLTHFKTVYFQYPEKKFIYHIFYTPLKEKPIIKIDGKEIVEYDWVTKEKALLKPLIPDEDECVKMFCGEILGK